MLPNGERDKLIFTGPVGVGKTTAIACISDVPPVTTDVEATDETLQKKGTTTVAMDYGFMVLEDGHYIHLYGTPGQERFEFMWDILSANGIGLVVLIDATSANPVEDLDLYLDHFAELVSNSAAVIGITRSDLASREVYLDIQQRLKERRQKLPIFELDARAKPDVKAIMHALLAELAYSGQSTTSTISIH